MNTSQQPARAFSGHVILTGATGLVGSAVLTELLRETDAEVTCLVRADDPASALLRIESALAACTQASSGEQVSRRVQAVPADIAQSELGLDAPARAELVARATHIIHCAASVRFDDPLATARAVNVDGAARMIQLAEEAHAAGTLKRLTMVSTAFVSGDTQRSFSEHELELGQGFRNTYERSKYEAESLARRAMGRLPINVVRPSIVIGNSQTGRTTAFNVLYAPLRMLVRQGTDVTLPVRGNLPLDIVPVDWVAKMIVEAMVHGEDGQTYAAASGARAQEMSQFASMAGEVFGVVAPRLLPAAVSDEVVDASLAAWHDIMSERGKAAMSAYEPYLSHGSLFDSWRGDHLMWRAGFAPFEPCTALRRSLEYAHVTDFGRRLRRDLIGRREVAAALAAGRAVA